MVLSVLLTCALKIDLHTPTPSPNQNPHISTAGNTGVSSILMNMEMKYRECGERIPKDFSECLSQYISANWSFHSYYSLKSIMVEWVITKG